MTDQGHVWRQVADLIGSARRSVLLVAPFVKKEVFEAVLNEVSQSVTEIDCVTRWVPTEVASGVSDPEIIGLAETDPRIRVRLCPALHAKVYVADDRCLVGSANLTAKGTNRAFPGSNIEILVEVPTGHSEVQCVLEHLGEVAIDATREMAELVRKQADALLGPEIAPRTQIANWYPVTRRPENLFLLYSGRERFAPAVEEGIVQDLALLDIPIGLPADRFNAEVRSRLHVIPELSRLTSGETLSNVELENALVAQRGVTELEARRTAETIAAWLRHFDNFYMEIASWELRHGREF